MHYRGEYRQYSHQHVPGPGFCHRRVGAPGQRALGPIGQGAWWKQRLCNSRTWNVGARVLSTPEPLRGGFGIFYDKPEGNIIFGQPGVVPFLQAATFQNGNLANPGGGTAGIPTIFTLSAVDPNFVVARTAQYSLSVQREMAWGLL